MSGPRRTPNDQLGMEIDTIRCQFKVYLYVLDKLRYSCNPQTRQPDNYGVQLLLNKEDGFHDQSISGCQLTCHIRRPFPLVEWSICHDAASGQNSTTSTPMIQAVHGRPFLPEVSFTISGYSLKDPAMRSHSIVYCEKFVEGTTW